VSVNTADQIKSAIEKLPREPFAKVRDWIAGLDADRWVAQLEADAAAGKLDAAAANAIRDFQDGRCTDLYGRELCQSDRLLANQ